MKKLLSLLLILAFVASVLSINAFTSTNNLLINGDFESGNEKGWSSFSSASASVSKSYGRNGSYGMKIHSRQGQYCTYKQDILPILQANGYGYFELTGYVKKVNSSESMKGQLVIRLKTTDSSGYIYLTSNSAELTTSWQKFTFNGIIYFNSNVTVTEALMYPQFFNTTTLAAYDMCIDDFSFVQTKTVEKLSVKDYSKIMRGEETTIGCIRWDAWYGHDSSETNVLVQVERSLSPAKYHWRAPFFAQVTSAGNIEIPEYTQEIFDKEIEYAMYAGVDYFAYVWYKDNMKKARVYHTTSKYRDEVKLCCCFDGNAICQDYARKEMATLLTQSYYMTVLDGRPLMYYFGSSGNSGRIAEDIAYYKNLTKKLGIPEPFAVVMNLSASECIALGADAISSYACGGGSNGSPYMQSANNCVNTWKSWANSGMQTVPTLTFGWHPQPRYDNPVSWTSVGKDSWVQYATDEEIQAMVEIGFNYMNNMESFNYTKANTMICYAWNEHDEGGWICPTISVDKDGKQLYNNDGTAKLETGRIEAFRKAVLKYKDIGETEKTPTPTAASTATPTPTSAPTTSPQASDSTVTSATAEATDSPAIITASPEATLTVATDKATNVTAKNSTEPKWWIIAVIGAGVAVAFVAVIEIKKRKKKQ